MSAGFVRRIRSSNGRSAFVLGLRWFPRRPPRRASRPTATFIAAIHNVRFTAVYCVSSHSASSAIRPLSRLRDSPPGRR